MIGENGFRARAGTLTLLYAVSSIRRETILRILESRCAGDHELAEECAEELAAELEGEYDEIEPVDLPGDIVLGPGAKLQISPKGRELVFVTRTVERWLAKRPGGALSLEDPLSGAAIQALVYGWSATVVHALAGEPRSLRELDAILDLPNSEMVAEHVEALEAVGLLACEEDAVLGERYVATRWLRQSIAPLAAAARLERRDGMEDTAPIDALDASAGLMLATPLVELPSDLSGACRLEVELDDGAGMAGAVAQVRPGEPPSADLGLDLDQVETEATGSLEDWLDTVIEPDAKRIRTRGDRKLAGILVAGLHRALFGPEP